jgi:hypothetical protein
MVTGEPELPIPALMPAVAPGCWAQVTLPIAREVDSGGVTRVHQILTAQPSISEGTAMPTAPVGVRSVLPRDGETIGSAVEPLATGVLTRKRAVLDVLCGSWDPCRRMPARHHHYRGGRRSAESALNWYHGIGQAISSSRTMMTGAPVLEFPAAMP